MSQAHSSPMKSTPFFPRPPSLASQSLTCPTTTSLCVLVHGHLMSQTRPFPLKSTPFLPRSPTAGSQPLSCPTATPSCVLVRLSGCLLFQTRPSPLKSTPFLPRSPTPVTQPLCKWYAPITVNTQLGTDYLLKESVPRGHNSEIISEVDWFSENIECDKGQYNSQNRSHDLFRVDYPPSLSGAYCCMLSADPVLFCFCVIASTMTTSFLTLFLSHLLIHMT